MGRNDLQPGDTIKCLDMKDLRTYTEALDFAGLYFTVDGLKITITEGRANEQNND